MLVTTLAAGDSQLSLTTHPAMPGWLLFVSAALALAAIAYLYVEQRRIASLTTVLALTALRCGLVALVIVLMISPALQWTRTRELSGTLWLLVDQSPSMGATDPQATPVELLRWADGQGLLPKSDRPRAGLFHVQLQALRSEFATLKPLTALGATGDDAAERARVRELKERMKAWTERLTAISKGIEADATLRAQAQSAVDSIDRITAACEYWQRNAEKAANVRVANDMLPWPMLQTNLDLATRDMGMLADRLDGQYVQGHALDAGVQAALARVKGLPRHARGQAALTTANTRLGDKPLPDVIKQYRMRLAAFSDTAQMGAATDGAAFDGSLRSAFAVNGQATNITSALLLAGQQIAADEPASVLIISDGRHNSGGDPTEPARLLAARGIKVFAIKTGSNEVSPDAAIEQIDAPEWVFRDDKLKANALVRLDGLKGKKAQVQLFRAGTLIDTQAVVSTANQHPERLTFSDTPPENATAIEYEVRVSDAPGETNLGNNRGTFRVAVKRERTNVLVVDTHPRWEFRYVSSFFATDPRMKTQVVLLQPATIRGIAEPGPVMASPENQNLEAQLLPDTREGWSKFDVIVLGDVPPQVLDVKKQQFLAAAVRDRGTTLITIAGPRHMPEAYSGQPLAELLPVTLSQQWAGDALARHTRFGFKPAMAPEGAASTLGQLGADGVEGGWSQAPLWYWHSPFTQAKPGATVHWQIAEADNAAIGPTGPNALETSRRRALLATTSIGLGRVLHLASDQTWRLRQVGGQNLQDRFWGRVLRWASGSDLPAGGKYVRFGSNRPRYAAGEPVVVTARVLREDLTPATGMDFSVTAKLLPARDAQGPNAASARIVGEAKFVETVEAPGYYRATLNGLPPGELELTLSGGVVERLLEIDPSVTLRALPITVTPGLNIEQRNINTDAPLLARIAQAGGGFAVDAADADVLAAHLPAIRQRLTTVEQAGFFTDPGARGTWWAHSVFLALFAVLIGAEWLVRKLSGLV